MGHSTGGLIAALYCAEGEQRDLVHTLILNSPFLEFNQPAAMRAALLPASQVIGKYWPYAKLPLSFPAVYGESLHKSKRGEWDYNLQWKPINGFPVYWGWVRGIHRAHKHVQAGLHLQIPVLLLHSDASASPVKWQDNSMRADTVLNVEDIKRYGPGIGSNVTLVEVTGGMHDLFLSAKAVREQALCVVLAWLAQPSSVQATTAKGQDKSTR
jgi:alpha-beta hydrolase superfamily lysophospholipase